MAEKVVRTHPILGVTHCSKCFAFYNSGEFGKGEDGSEYYCRWCGQGGEVYCCSSCPFVFCNKCIRLNLTQTGVDAIEENDDWQCFVCDPKVIYPLKGLQWALLNYIEKETQKIKNMNLSTEGDANYLLSRDTSTCCAKKRLSDVSNGKKPLLQNKRKANGLAGPLSKKPMTGPGQKNNDEVVCTPDILSMLEEEDNQHPPAPPTLPRTTQIRQIRPSSTIPPPLAIRHQPGAPRVRFPIAQPRTAAPNPSPLPVYHTIGGFRIDLNHAARQEIFRLPNGKLIQVRKQVTNAPNATAAATPGLQNQNQPMGMGPRTITPSIRPNVMNRNNVRPMGNIRMNRPALPVQQSRFLISDATPAQIAAANLNTSNVVQNNMVPVQAPTQITPAPAASTGVTMFQQQNGSIIVNRAQHPDNDLGKAKTGFEDKIIAGMEICQHTINKMITLSNSSSFKTSRTFTDLKGLYIHLKYLYTFTLGKLNSLQEKLAEDMEKLAEHDTALNEKGGDDDDLEIVEKDTEVITVDSDDEESAKKKTPRKQNLEPKELHSPTEKIEVMPDIPILPVMDDSRQTSRATSEESTSYIDIDIERDVKLNKKPVIKAEKVEERYDFLKEPVEKLKAGEEPESIVLPSFGDEDCFVVEPPRPDPVPTEEHEDDGIEIEDKEDQVVEINDDEKETESPKSPKEQNPEEKSADENLEKEPETIAIISVESKQQENLNEIEKVPEETTTKTTDDSTLMDISETTITQESIDPSEITKDSEMKEVESPEPISEKQPESEIEDTPVEETVDQTQSEDKVASNLPEDLEEISNSPLSEDKNDCSDAENLEETSHQNGNDQSPEQNGNDLIENGIDELLNSISTEEKPMDTDIIPDLAEFDKDANIVDPETLQKEVTEILEETPMETN